MNLKTRIFLFLTLFISFLPFFAYAQLPFGGKIITTLPCTCSFNFLITMVPAGTLPPQVIFRPGISLLYEYYQFFLPGTALLGKTLGVDTCWEGVFPFCLPISVAPMVQMMGTSLAPPI